MKPPILLATDGTEGSRGAVRVARELAARQERQVVVVSVIEPALLYGPSSSYPVFLADPTLEEAQRQIRESSVQSQIDCDHELPPAWDLEILLGSTAPAIVRKAAECGADLIVLGLGRHSAVDRWLGSETALKVVHLSHLPVLAVSADTETLPRRVLVGVDFSEFSQDAARAATQLLPGGGEVHLAHVAWTNALLPGTSGELEWMETYRAGARTRLEGFSRDVRARGNVRCFTTLLEGEPSRALIRYARMTGAELIATGSHGYGFFGRMMMGSVSTRLLRQAPCSLLISPPRTAAVETVAATRSGSAQASEVVTSA
jgi:nucleotide-binding universal stress UspA family protein